jgi:Fe-S-cluster-containing dehydrogenase component
MQEILKNPEVARQPVMCQHCDNAPCENVCPVAATTHSDEGINQMAYNRCIGTRYCNNNCPYKVRRFNWYDYTQADALPANTMDPAGMTLDLPRMVLNPDVTVRAKGVMEKCSFCVQRIQDKKLQAKLEGRPLADGEIKTACQQACPTKAITFGDMSDKKSKVTKLMKSERNYHLLEELHTLPSVGYLTKVRNKVL